MQSVPDRRVAVDALEAGGEEAFHLFADGMKEKFVSLLDSRGDLGGNDEFHVREAAAFAALFAQ